MALKLTTPQQRDLANAARDALIANLDALLSTGTVTAELLADCNQKFATLCDTLDITRDEAMDLVVGD